MAVGEHLIGGERIDMKPKKTLTERLFIEIEIITNISARLLTCIMFGVHLKKHIYTHHSQMSDPLSTYTLYVNIDVYSYIHFQIAIAFIHISVTIYRGFYFIWELSTLQTAYSNCKEDFLSSEGSVEITDTHRRTETCTHINARTHIHTHTHFNEISQYI